MKSIQDIVETLTAEEKEIHKELIKECLEREADCVELEKSLQENVKELSALMVKMLTDLNNFNKLSIALTESCYNAKENLLKDSIALIPDEKFYHE